MSRSQPLTRSGLAAEAILRSLLEPLLAQRADMDEESTFTRQKADQRIAQYRAAIALIPDAEVEAVLQAEPGATYEEARNRLAFAAIGGEMAAAA